MTTRRTRLSAGFCLSLLLACLCLVPAARVRAAAPDRLSDQEFWKISSEASEPDGSFRSENLLSNELGMQWVVPDLVSRAKPGRAYMGVGPEQNFTYIAALKPSIVFIIDIRRGNLDLQLMYKALFELSADRAEFYSRLFSKKRPDGLTSASTALQIVTAYERVPTTEAVYKDNLKAVEDLLMKKHGFPLSSLTFRGSSGCTSSSTGSDRASTTTRRAAVSAAAARRPTRISQRPPTRTVSSATFCIEDRFTVLKDLESRNLVVPVIGNFGGPKAIRAVADYLKSRDLIVSAFYLSNVEQYLQQDGIWNNFCRSVAALPLDDTSTFIRSTRGGFGPGPGLNSELGHMAAEAKTCR